MPYRRTECLILPRLAYHEVSDVRVVLVDRSLGRLEDPTPVYVVFRSVPELHDEHELIQSVELRNRHRRRELACLAQELV
jgi:hypothetical protein